jgi:hypothetical protein
MANIELDGANKKIKVDSGDLTLDVPGDIILDADGGDLTFADGGTNLLKVTNSSSDVVLQTQVDAKDIIFKQYDGRNLLEINDGGYVAIANGATGPGQLRLYEDTDNGTNYSAFQVGTQSGDITYTLPTADGSSGQALTTNGSGTLSWADAGSADPSSADGDTLGTASAEWSDLYLADGGIVYFGNDQDIRLTHNADKGLIIKHSATADDKPVILTLQTGETDMAADDVIGKIEFQAPDEGTGTDAVLVSGAIQAVAEGDHSSSSNATRLEFMTGASEAATAKMSISSGGIVGVGATLPGDLGVGLHIKTADSGASVNNDGDELIIENGGSGLSAGMTILSATNGYGSICFGDSGDDNIGIVRYDHNNNTLDFFTGGSEQMYLSSTNFQYSGGVTKFGTSTDFGGTRFHIKSDFNTGRGLGLNSSDGASGGGLVPMIYFGVENSAQGSVNAGGGSVQYNTSSDYRRKENVSNLTGAIDRVKQFKPYRFNFTDDPSKKVKDGFFAHEVTPIVPESVTGEKDAVEVYKKGQDIPVGKSVGDNILDDSGNTIPDYQGLDHSKLVPLLTAAMQELEVRVKTLEDA